MTQFEILKSMDIETLAEWLDKNGQFDGSPWTIWFDKLYCGNCESIMCHYEDNSREFPCSYCEIYEKCRFFPNMSKTPDNKDIIKMWLETEVVE